MAINIWFFKNFVIKTDGQVSITVIAFPVQSQVAEEQQPLAAVLVISMPFIMKVVENKTWMLILRLSNIY